MVDTHYMQNAIYLSGFGSDFELLPGKEREEVLASLSTSFDMQVREMLMAHGAHPHDAQQNNQSSMHRQARTASEVESPWHAPWFDSSVTNHTVVEQQAAYHHRQFSKKGLKNQKLVMSQHKQPVAAASHGSASSQANHSIHPQGKKQGTHFAKGSRQMQGQPWESLPCESGFAQVNERGSLPSDLSQLTQFANSTDYLPRHPEQGSWSSGDSGSYAQGQSPQGMLQTMTAMQIQRIQQMKGPPLPMKLVNRSAPRTEPPFASHLEAPRVDEAEYSL